jgi:hypothetical protein
LLSCLTRADKIKEEVNEDIAAFIPALEKYLEGGLLKPMEYEVVADGFDGVLKGLEIFNAGRAGGKKVLVRLQAE